MQQLPASFVDFASALKILADSQADITELVTKWDEITDTTSPKTVKVSLSDGTYHSVDNLAKIRNDLVAGLSLDTPTVKTITVTTAQSSSRIRSSDQSCQVWHGDGVDNFDAVNGFSGVYKNTRNEVRTACFPASSTLNVSLEDMPRVVMVGAKISEDTLIDTVTINVSPSNLAFTEQNLMAASKHYYALVTFVNRNFGNDPSVMAGAPVTVILKSADITISRTIPPYMSVTYMMFGTPGGTVVNMHELVPDIVGGANG